MGRKITILITGASGHIGSRWLAEPASCVEKVIALVRPGSVFPQISSIIKTEIREGRIPSIDPATLLEGIDVVIHLAAATPVPGTTEREYMKVNRDWTKRLGEECLDRQVKLIFVSTSSIYAGKDGELLTENTPHIQAQNTYAESKYAAETALRELSRRGLGVTILRFGSVFGASGGMNFRTAVNRFVQQAALGRPIEVWRTAKDQIRPFTYVGDCAAAFNFIIEHDIWKGEVYNIVSENSTVPIILEKIQTFFPESDIKFVDSERMNNFSYGADDTKIRSLGFTPHGTISDGIIEIVDYLRT